jgi:hypothetical protein
MLYTINYGYSVNNKLREKKNKKEMITYEIKEYQRRKNNAICSMGS